MYFFADPFAFSTGYFMLFFAIFFSTSDSKSILYSSLKYVRKMRISASSSAVSLRDCTVVFQRKFQAILLLRWRGLRRGSWGRGIAPSHARSVMRVSFSGLRLSQPFPSAEFYFYKYYKTLLQMTVKVQISSE